MKYLSTLKTYLSTVFDKTSGNLPNWTLQNHRQELQLNILAAQSQLQKDTAALSAMLDMLARLEKEHVSRNLALLGELQYVHPYPRV